MVLIVDMFLVSLGELVEHEMLVLTEHVV